ncbi:hypothetical protein GXW83_28425 [Streptacidiphilus sp. PB12-B1b]|uniref:hypothetical protein n=1 Tax=Streptacidiphilus sp. PB12-B1b TaxID=2705012 RepID=UPI0015FCC17E|nr:hypothetical protein [Streptacidiphilus sp. PB12-B1b]QMU79047.1 hypothetical protein GXW83_28425 [Streptacidiphilus sp. PB12-B1b]
MARIRTIKPEAFISESLAQVSVEAERTFFGLLTQADDHGRHRDNAAIIAGLLWPLRAEHTSVHVEDDLQQLAQAGLLCRYTGCDGRRYLHVVTWFDHQKIDKPSQSRLPGCPEHHAAERCAPCKGVCTKRVGESPTPTRAFADASATLLGGLAEASPNAPRAFDLPAAADAMPSAPGAGQSTGQQDGPAATPTAADSTVRETAAQGGFAEASGKAPRSLGEGSAPGSRILDPGSSSPTGRAAPDGPASARQLVGEYVAACGQRPPGDLLGHLGRVVNKLLDEGIAADNVRAGLRRYTEIGGHPSRLPSLVNDAMNHTLASLVRPGFGPNVPAHQAWTNPVDAAAAYAEEL